MIINRTFEYRKRHAESILYCKMLRKITFITTNNQCAACLTDPYSHVPNKLCKSCFNILYKPQAHVYNTFIQFYNQYKKCENIEDYKKLINVIIQKDCQIYKNLLRISLLKIEKIIKKLYLKSKLSNVSEQYEKTLFVYQNKILQEDYADLNVYKREIEMLQIEIDYLMTKLVDSI